MFTQPLASVLIASAIAFTGTTQAAELVPSIQQFQCDIFEIIPGQHLPNSWPKIESKVLTPVPYYFSEIYQSGDVSYELDTQNLASGSASGRLSLVTLKNHYLSMSFPSSDNRWVALEDYEQKIRIECVKLN